MNLYWQQLYDFCSGALWEWLKWVYPKWLLILIRLRNITFFFFKQVAAPAAYGGSWARGQATATVEATLSRVSSYAVSWMGSPDITFIFIEKNFFFVFLGLHPWHMEVPRLGVKLELWLLAIATATWDLSRVCNLHHSSWQCWILNPLSRTRDWARNLMDTSWVCYVTTEPWWELPVRAHFGLPLR